MSTAIAQFGMKRILAMFRGRVRHTNCGGQL